MGIQRGKRKGSGTGAKVSEAESIKSNEIRGKPIARSDMSDGG